jgi:hypothetical protein
MTGTYAIAEVVDDSNKRPQKTLFCFLLEDGDIGFPTWDQKFNNAQIKSLNMVKKMVASNGGQVFDNLEQIAYFLNNL